MTLPAGWDDWGDVRARITGPERSLDRYTVTVLCGPMDCGHVYRLTLRGANRAARRLVARERARHAQPEWEVRPDPAPDREPVKRWALRMPTEPAEPHIPMRSVTPPSPMTPGERAAWVNRLSRLRADDVDRRAAWVEWRDAQRAACRSTRAVLVGGAPSAFIILSGVMSLTITPPAGVPRFASGMVVALAVLVVLAVICVVADDLVRWVRNV